jgi:DNA (cytosine-5)-methyltransferase 1
VGESSSESEMSLGIDLRAQSACPDAATATSNFGSTFKHRPKGSVVDLFCGAGGLSHGFFLEDYAVAAGLDIDEECRFAYEHNNHAPFIRADVGKLNSQNLRSLFYANEPSILVGCAPCQPFSTYNHKNDDPKWRLVDKFGDLICEVLPDIVSMENVPRLLEFQGGAVFRGFVTKLEAAGYKVEHNVVFAPEYGIPQNRSRLVLLASRRGYITIEGPSFQRDQFPTVADAIGTLAPIGPGEADPNDRLHRSSRLSALNLERIKVSKPGGSWRDWDENLVADCHRSETGHSYGSVYGRMRYDEPSPTITTQFFGFGNGRFGHPEQDRGLSIREGAILQSFPPDYAFVAPGQPVQFKKLGRMIGNAVPVTLGRVIARSIKAHVAEHWA